MLDEAAAVGDAGSIRRSASGWRWEPPRESGRDKATLVVPQLFEPFGLWVEQLVAESTGKQGVGIVPIAGEAVGPPEAYGADRLFVHLRNGSGDETHAGAVGALGSAGAPVVTVDVAEPLAHRRRVRPLGNRDGSRRRHSRRQPVRRTERPAGEGCDPCPARRIQESRAPARRSLATAMLADVAGDALEKRAQPPVGSEPARLPGADRPWRLFRAPRVPGPGPDPGDRDCRIPACRSGAHPCRDHVRIRSAVSALDRPAPQRRRRTTASSWS